MNSFKKILIITSEFPPQPGGIGNHALNLALQLSKNEYEVTVISDIRSKDGKEEKDFDLNLPFKVYRNKRHKFSIFTYLKRIKTYKKNIHNYDIVLASGKFSLWLVGLIAVKKELQKIAVIHGSELNLKGIYKRFTEASLQKFKTVIAVSNYTKSLVEHLKLKKTIVIPNGFSNSKKLILPKQLKSSSSLNLITVGNVSDRKGQLNVIKCLPLLKQKFPNIHYHIVGIPSEKDTFQKIAKELKVAENITFHGKVSDLEKYTLLQKSTIFMMLSNTTKKGDVEGFGIAILEANAINIPAIGARNCGIEDAILDKNSGILVSVKNKNEVISAVQEIYENLDFYQKNAKKWSEKFKWEKVILSYISVLNK